MNEMTTINGGPATVSADEGDVPSSVLGIGYEPEVLEREHLRTLAEQEPERVQPGHEVAAVDPDLDQTRDSTLFGVAAALAFGKARERHRSLAGPFGDGRADSGVGRLAGDSGGQPLEVLTPLGVYAPRVAEVLLVKRVQKVGVAAVQRCVFGHWRKMQAGP